jgi:hypothetical protein
VRTVYVLEKRPDVSGPGLEEAGRYNNAGPKVNNRWDTEKVSPSDLEKMKPFLTKIKTLKIRGLASIGIVASFIRC